jgi:hypothetical protein
MRKPTRSFAVMLVVVACTLITGACNRARQTQEGEVHVKPVSDASSRTAALRSRINGFFYSALVPKLKTCWGGVQGKGGIAFKLTYRKAGNSWEWQDAEVTDSNLPKEQPAAALACMKDSARGSSFPMEENEVAQRLDHFDIYWAWPVPFPADTSQLARMIDTGGGGREPMKKCTDCVVDQTTHKSVCASSSSGYRTCKPDGTGTGCMMTGAGCTSGWSGDWAGILIM